jgi:hypothetical protein
MKPLSLVRCLLCAALLGWPAQAIAQTPPPVTPDILCRDQPEGAVEAIPAPFDAWMTIICTPQGQSVTAKPTPDGQLWFLAGTSQIVSLPSAPPKESPTPGETLAPKALPRFSAFIAQEAEGDNRDGMLKGMADVFPGLKIGPDDRLAQLAAQTTADLSWYNFFVRFAGGRPRQMLICHGDCEAVMLVEVMTTAEAADRIAASAQPASPK